MGWNDHVEFIETECLDCGAVTAWEYWSETGRQRYIGAIGELLHVDATRHGKCPECGSTNGAMVGDDEQGDYEE